MPFARVSGQAATGFSASASSIAATLPAGATAGHLLVATVETANTTVTGVGPGTWHTGPSSPGTAISITVYWKLAAGGETTVTATLAGADECSIEVAEYTVPATGTIAVDVHASATFAAVGPQAINAGAASAGELIVAAIGTGGNNATGLSWDAAGTAMTLSANLVGNMLGTGYLVAGGGGQNLNVVTANYTNIHSADILVVTFQATVSTPTRVGTPGTATTSASAVLQLFLGATPTAGNVLLVTVAGVETGWTPPDSSWVPGPASKANITDVAMFAKRVTTGMTTGPYTFTEIGWAAGEVIAGEIEEYSGFTGSAIAWDLRATASGSVVSSLSVNAGTTLNTAEVVKAAIAVGGVTGLSWSGGVTVDQVGLGALLYTATDTPTGVTSYPAVQAGWTNAHSAEMIVGSVRAVNQTRSAGLGALIAPVSTTIAGSGTGGGGTGGGTGGTGTGTAGNQFAVAAGVHVDNTEYGGRNGPVSYGSFARATSGSSPFGLASPADGWEKAFQLALPWYMVELDASVLDLCNGNITDLRSNPSGNFLDGRRKPKFLFSLPMGFGGTHLVNGVSDGVMVTLAAIANGAMDSVLSNLCTTITTIGFPTAMVRVGWETDGYVGTSGNNPGSFWTTSPLHYSGGSPTALADYKAAFQHVVTYIRAHAPGTLVEWNLFANRNGLYTPYTPAQLDPGPTYYDLIGCDSYLINTDGSDASGFLGGPQRAVAYASQPAISKPVVFSEWGFWNKANNGEWAGAPTLMQAAISFMDSLAAPVLVAGKPTGGGALYAHMYFNGIPGSGQFAFDYYPNSFNNVFKPRILRG